MPNYEIVSIYTKKKENIRTTKSLRFNMRDTEVAFIDNFNDKIVVTVRASSFHIKETEDYFEIINDDKKEAI